MRSPASSDQSLQLAFAFAFEKTRPMGDWVGDFSRASTWCLHCRLQRPVRMSHQGIAILRNTGFKPSSPDGRHHNCMQRHRSTSTFAQFAFTSFTVDCIYSPAIARMFVHTLGYTCCSCFSKGKFRFVSSVFLKPNGMHLRLRCTADYELAGR